MTALPPKIKAFVGTIKATYLDDDSKRKSPSDLFEGLVKMELALRGVLVQDESKLWPQVQSSIGKTLLENLPNPLLAGATVLTGRLAEALASALASASEDSSSSYPIDAAILQRAKDINDIRWILLLQQQVPFLEIARGYFCKAASIQTETPPMWKKVWDVWTLQSGEDEHLAASTPFEAHVAIEQLVRIAVDKGNAKRVAELQVLLVFSYLNNPKRIAVTTTRIGKQDIVVAQAFGDDFTAKLPSDASTIVEKAQQVLEACTLTELNETDQRLIPVLSVRVGMALEETKVEEMAQQQHQANQNRSVSSSLETCRTKSRHKLFLEDKDALNDAGIALRDLVVSLWRSQTGQDNSYWVPSMNQCIERLRDRAMAQIQKNTSHDKGWRILLEFVLPLLESLQVVSQWSINHDRKERMQHLLESFSSTSEEEQSTISLVALTFTKVYWMLLTNGLDASMDASLKFVLDLLSVLIHHGASKETQTPAAVGATSKQSPLSRQWKLARSIISCGISQGNQMLIDQVSREAVATKKQDDAALGMLQSLVAWSGWYQRPWSYCSNLSDVRRLLAAAKLTGERSMGTLESILMDLACADAELLNGGFPKQSCELYTQLLDTLEHSSKLLDSVVLVILQGHCYNGLARACQIDEYRGQLTKVQDLATKTLDLLDGIEIPVEIKPLHIWHDHSLFLSAISHHRSVARQLIADSLISQGRSEEARSFLEAAVQDAPLDAGAAVALGAFLFRVAFYLDEKRSSDAVKAAQIQLLKAAKLDPSKADPFALLGLWFEECGDPNRALGCFTKSLTLDPCNPIAGRGLLRLKTREEMIEELDAALGINSPICGWAWRGVGLNKIFLEAEDEFAVVALLKALRSRDVSAPANETLGIFYHRPGTVYVNERADALAELAMCYRRLGRFTASIRAFYAAIESAGEHITSSVLCSCAQGMYKHDPYHSFELTMHSLILPCERCS
jgi:tetratricopeptide (TPR) repeat protein